MDVVEGYKETKIGRIPKDWELYTIGELGKISTSSVDKKSKANETEINLINYMDVFGSLEKKITSDNKFMRVTARTTQLISNQVFKGDVLFTPSSETKKDIGISAVVYEDLPNTLYSYHLLRLSFKKEINIDFKCYLFNSFGVLNQFELLSQGLTRYTIGLNNFKEIFVSLPTLKEQQKIAEILSTVDEQISTTQAIIDKSKELKKGLMQILFTEGIGHTEFKETKIGRIPKDWEVVKLNDYVLKVGSGVTPKGGSSVYLKEGISLLRSQNVLYGKLFLDDVACIGESQYQKMKNSQLQEHDVLLNISGASIGRSAVVPQHILPANVNQHVCIIRAKDLIYSNYLCSFLLSREGQNQIFRLQAGGNREGLNFQQIRSFKIPLPPFTEQQKIAEILSEADAKIEKEEQQKAKLGELKKGLMQQLLTGKKRVKV